VSEILGIMELKTFIYCTTMKYSTQSTRLTQTFSLCSPTCKKLARHFGSFAITPCLPTWCMITRLHCALVLKAFVHGLARISAKEKRAISAPDSRGATRPLLKDSQWRGHRSSFFLPLPQSKGSSCLSSSGSGGSSSSNISLKIASSLSVCDNNKVSRTLEGN
jgi:hypothetical protein